VAVVALGALQLVRVTEPKYKRNKLKNIKSIIFKFYFRA
jgi:hypothetical protein